MHPDGPRVHHELVVLEPSRDPQRVDTVLDRPGEVGRLALESDPAARHERDVEQVVQQAAEVPHLPAEDRGGLRP